MTERKFETPPTPDAFIEGTMPTPDEIRYLESRYEESRQGGEREYLDLFLAAPEEKRFKVGPFFVAVVDNDEIHHHKGINVNISCGWQSGGITLILLSSKLSPENLEKVLCHEMQEDLDWSKNLHVEGYGPHQAHEVVEKDPKDRKQILDELEEFQKSRGEKM